MVDPEDVTQAAFEDFFRRCAAGEFRLSGWDGMWAVFAVIVANPPLHAPPVNEVFLNGGPTFRGSLFAQNSRVASWHAPIRY